MLTDIAANHTAHTTEATAEKQRLLQAIQRAPDSITKRAYQIRLQIFRRNQREQRERQQLIDWAKGKTWTFSKQIKVPTVMHLPAQLNGQPDRGQWGEVLEAYMRDLYQTDDSDKQDIHDTLWRIIDAASHTNESPMKCDATELRDIIKFTPPHKAAGPDGVPSQLLKSITFAQTKSIAGLFTQMSNDIDYNSIHRPDSWTQALAIMIPKQLHAEELDKHRAITLMNQAQKIYSKWIMTQITDILDEGIAEHQLGFRRRRQAAEAIHLTQRLLEISREWQRPITIVKLDLKKAFDKMTQGPILRMLEKSKLPRRVAFNVARELIGNHTRPQAYGCSSKTPVPQQRGARQGPHKVPLKAVCSLLAP